MIFDKSDDIKEWQPENMPHISLTEIILKFDKSKENKRTTI